MNEHVLNFIADETMHVSVAGQEFDLVPGSVVWIPCGVPHSFYLGTPGVPFSMLNLRWRCWWRGKQVRPNTTPYCVNDMWQVRSWFETIIADRRSSRDDALDRFRHLVYLILSECRQQNITVGGLSLQQRQALQLYQAEHYTERPKPRDLARVVGLSPDYFRRQFLKSYGCSARTWLMQQRLQAAAQALFDAPDRSISDTAVDFGYDVCTCFRGNLRKYTAVVRGSGARIVAFNFCRIYLWLTYAQRYASEYSHFHDRPAAWR